MNEYEFLSSLSPKVNPKKKKQGKGPTYLSLKKYFRRSSVCDKAEATIPTNSLDVIEILSSDSCSSNLSGQRKSSNRSELIDNFKYEADLDNVDVILPSPENDLNSIKRFGTGKKTHNCHNTQPNTLPRTKLFEIERWLDSVEKCQDNVKIPEKEIFDHSLFSYEDFENVKECGFNKMINSTLIVKPTELKESSPESFGKFNSDCIKEDKKGGRLSKSYEAILDEIYGISWRGMKNKIFQEGKHNFQNLHMVKGREKSATDDNRKQIEVDRMKDNLGTTCDLLLSSNETKYQNMKMQALNSNGIACMDGKKKNHLEYDFENTKSKHDLNSKKYESEVVSSSPNVNMCINTNLQVKNFIRTNNHIEEDTDSKVVETNSETTKKLKKTQRKTKVKISERIGSIENECEEEIEIRRSRKHDGSQEITRRKMAGSITCSFLESLSDKIPDCKSNKAAKLFRITYKQSKEILASELFVLYNKEIFEQSLSETVNLEWNSRMVSTAGYCHSKRITHRDGTVQRTAKIVLSNKVLDAADRLRDTLIHEMCHAATWIINEVHDGHGEYWKAWTRKAREIFPELPPIKTCHNYQITTKYVYKCTKCGYSIRRHRKSLDIERKRCGYCLGEFEILINKVNKKGEQKTVPVTPKKKPNQFALFVKENYSNIKTPDIKHNEVMKRLGEKFREIKIQT